MKYSKLKINCKKNKLQKEKIETEKEKENKKRQFQNPLPAAVKSYITIKDIEQVIDDQQYKKDVSEMKKQKRELEQLQWVLDKEKNLKFEQNTQFEENQNIKNPDLPQDIMNAKKKGMENKESPSKTKEQKKWDKSKQIEKMQMKSKLNLNKIIILFGKREFIQFVTKPKKPLLPGEYDSKDLDLIQQKYCYYLLLLFIPQQQPQQQVRKMN
ncbi:unnamed protein product [Paramecium octaurelia]|uniref:Uncharacterized protein n=1 Tax=Paramecium octaurelia TaxID=43137 RepID=A0A8S1WVJ7_PAROT|nr:unnamed protein product [Paramecium octaurelia]